MNSVYSATFYLEGFIFMKGLNYININIKDVYTCILDLADFFTLSLCFDFYRQLCMNDSWKKGS